MPTPTSTSTRLTAGLLLAALGLLPLLAAGNGVPIDASDAYVAGAAAPPVPLRLYLPLTARDGFPPRSVTLVAVGDVSLAREVVDRMEAEGAAYPFVLVRGTLEADITFANLEGALSDRGTPWPKAYNFRTPPRLANGLNWAGFNVLTLANNHSLDYGADGLVDTLQTLDELGIKHVGAGVDFASAHAAAIIDVGGVRVAFLGYVATPDESNGFSIYDWAAGLGLAGLSIGTPEGIAADVVAARQVADFVIVAVHAGTEYSAFPDATQVALADAALAAGADAYIGAHPHVLQPIELRGHQLIAWSLGNFVFDLDPVDLANLSAPRFSVILRITLTPGVGVTSVEAIPVVLDENEDRPRLGEP